MTFTARLYQGQDRQADRRALNADATLRARGDQPIDIEIRDLSVSGARFSCAETLMPADHIRLGLPGLGQRIAYVVRRDGDDYGCEFETPLRDGDIEALLEADPIVQGAFGSGSAFELRDLAAGNIRKWPLAARFGFVTLSATLCWVAVFLAASAAIR